MIAMSRFVLTYMDYEGCHHIIGERWATSAKEAVNSTVVHKVFGVYAWPISDRDGPMTIVMKF